MNQCSYFGNTELKWVNLHQADWSTDVKIYRSYWYRAQNYGIGLDATVLVMAVASTFWPRRRP